MTHKFVIELTDTVKGYKDGVDYLERIYGAEEITDNEIYNQAFNDGYKQGRADVIDELLHTMPLDDSQISFVKELKEQK